MEKLTPEEYHTKFVALTSQTLKGQKKAFVRRFIFQLKKKGVKNVEQTANLFEEFANKQRIGANAIPLTSPHFSAFLKSEGIQWTHRERKDAIKDFDLDSNGEICLLEFLMIKYRAMILRQYFLRQGYPEDGIPKELLEAHGIVSDRVLNKQMDISQALVSEMFQHAIGCDKILDRGLVEFAEIMAPHQEEEARLQGLMDDPETSQVDRIKAKNELKKLNEQFKEPLRNTNIKFVAAIKKVFAQQDKMVKEVNDAISNEVMARKQGTISGRRNEYLNQGVKRDI